MEKATDSNPVVSGGSFLERFKLVQQLGEREKGKHVGTGQPKSTVNLSGTPTPKLVIGKSSTAIKTNESRGQGQ